MGNILPDLRFALRTIRRAPLFASVAILSLALGIGANTAIFSLMDQLMLRLLPIKDPEQLVMIYQTGAHNGNNMGYRMNSYPIYRDFQTKSAPFSDVLCRRLIEASLSVDSGPERVHAEMVSGNFFSMLGVKAALGRVFSSTEDDQVYGGHPNVVLSYDYWISRFNGDRNVIGKKVLVNNYPMTIVGVSAAGFAGLDPAQAPEIRVPILMKAQMVPFWKWLEMEDRRSRWVQVFGRLKPGYTAETAQAPMAVLFHQIREEEAKLPAAKNWSAYARQQFMRGQIHIEAAASGYSDLRRSFSKALVVLMCMVGLVLLIACANVANLLIARAFARQKEIAVRLSIGASRGQLIRQLLTESLVLSFAGAALGVVIAIGMTRGLLALIPVEGSPLLLRSDPDTRVLLFTAALTCLTGLGFGLLPALRASRPDLWTTLKDAVGSIASSGGSLFLRKGLVSAQVALSFLLLFGAGLFVRSLENLKSTHTGFQDLDNLVTFQLSPILSGYTQERTLTFYQDLLERIRTIPGMKNAAAATEPLLSGDEWDSSVNVEGYQAKDGEDMQAFMNALSPGYFQTMGIHLLEGRDFDRRDLAPPWKVCIVNRKFAQYFFGDKSPIGRHVKRDENLEIIGVVEDSLFEGPREGVHRQVFVPYLGSGSGFAVYARTSMDSTASYAALRDAVKSLAETMPVYQMKTLASQLDEVLLSERLVALLSAGFGVLATLLAAIGLYGVMAFVVTRRTKEMGVRMALGAHPSTVIWLVMREVLLLLAIGLAIGLPAALGLGRYVGSQLYEIKASDPTIAVVTVVVLFVVAALAGLIPARRASRIDPILALRYD